MSWQSQTLAAVLSRRVAEREDATALVTLDGRLDWRHLDAQARRVAKALMAAGIAHGDFVGLLAGNDQDWVAVFYGAALVGAVTVPVNTRYKADEIRYGLNQAEAKLLVMAGRFLKIDFCAAIRDAEPAIDRRLPGEAMPALRSVVVIGDEVPAGATAWEAFLAGGAQIGDEQLEAAIRAVTPHDLLLIQYTSGTTAHPKGVMLTHDNMLRNAAAVAGRMGLGRDDVYFNCRPFFHVAGSTLSLLASLQAGACLATLPTFDAGAALQMLAAERCTFISGNDTLFQMLMAHPDFDRATLHLRGGWAASGPDTMRRIVEEMGIERICWAYGLSEASPNVVFSEHTDPLALRIHGRALPHDGVRVRIVDDASGRVCRAGEPGEIQVEGWGVMKGYLKLPEQNAKVFTDDGWLRTGDLGRLHADGRLELVGRLKDVFRVGGENVAPAEIEQVLLAHPAVAQAQAVGVPDARLGEVPAAFVTLKPGASLDVQDLLAWCRDRMANFRVPRHVAVVEDFESIGMTASGKVQKTRLRAHAVERFAPRAAA